MAEHLFKNTEIVFKNPNLGRISTSNPSRTPEDSRGSQRIPLNVAKTRANVVTARLKEAQRTAPRILPPRGRWTVGGGVVGWIRANLREGKKWGNIKEIWFARQLVARLSVFFLHSFIIVSLLSSLSLPIYLFFFLILLFCFFFFFFYFEQRRRRRWRRSQLTDGITRNF